MSHEPCCCWLLLRFWVQCCDYTTTAHASSGVMKYTPYSMLLCTSIVFLDALVSVMQRWTRGNAIYFYLSAFLLLYTHYFGGFVLAAGYIVLVIYAALVRKDEQRRLPFAPIIVLP